MTNRIDHSNCTHPRTPAGRAACRKQGTTPAPAPTLGVPYFSPEGEAARARKAPSIAADLRKLEADQARRKLPTAGRADRIIRARVAAGGTGRKVAASDPRTCVQWELHTGSGRCACGWAA